MIPVCVVCEKCKYYFGKCYQNSTFKRCARSRVGEWCKECQKIGYNLNKGMPKTCFRSIPIEENLIAPNIDYFEVIL